MFEAPWEMPLRELPAPWPAPGEVLVRVRAAGVCGSDVHGFTGSTGRRTPGVIMGHEFSGIVEALGEGASGHVPGDQVAIQPIISCGVCAQCRRGRPNLCLHRRGIGWSVHGGYAEFVCVPARNALPLPSGVEWVQGALAEPLAVALHAVNLTPLNLGDRVVVLGAGTVGLLCVLALRQRGAGPIIVSDLSDHRLELARRLGASEVIRADRQDPVSAVHDLTGGEGADAVLEVVGAPATARQSVELVRHGGAVTWVGNAAPLVEVPMQEIVTRELTVRGSYAFSGEFARALELLGSGQLDLAPLAVLRAGLDDGPALIRELAQGTLEAVKVVLEP